MDPPFRVDIADSFADLFEQSLELPLRVGEIGGHESLEVLRSKVIHREVGDGVLDRQQDLDFHLEVMDADQVGVLEHLPEFEFLLELGQDDLRSLRSGIRDDFFTDQLQREPVSGTLFHHLEDIADLAGGDITDDGVLVDLEFAVSHCPALESSTPGDLSHCRYSLWSVRCSA